MISKVLNDKPLSVFVLCYHSISDDGWYYSVPLINLKKQINYLRNNFEIISLSDLEKIINGGKKVNKASVVITFDDGYKNILSAKKFFKSIDIKPAVFVIGDKSIVDFKELGTNREFLSNSDIKKLLKDGWEVGSHTLTHPNMNKLNDLEIEREISGSKKKIEKNLNIKIKYIAYPKGKYTNKITNLVNKAGYKLGLSMDDGVIDLSTSKFAIPRIGVDGSHSFTEFKYLYYPLLSKFRKLLK